MLGPLEAALVSLILLFLPTRTRGWLDRIQENVFIDEHGGLDSDRVRKRRVERVFAPIARAASLDPSIPPRILGTEEVQAYAVPTGSVFVTRGLLAKLDDSELAGVLAHEAAHVALGHIAQRRLAWPFLLLLEGLVLGRLVRIVAYPLLRPLLMRLVGAAFSREHETEADITAVTLLQHAGLDPRSLERAFLKIDAEATADPHTGPADWLSSHPPTMERIAKVRTVYRRLELSAG